MKSTILFLSFGTLFSGCVHMGKTPIAELTPPWKTVADGVANLVDRHAAHADFNQFRESSVQPERLHAFAAVERITGSHARKYSANERAQLREWFRSSASVWFYTFEGQFSGVLFCDESGRVRHALLLG